MEPGFTFTGFLQPVDNQPTPNSVKGGSAVPVKFSLGGDQGVNVFAEGYPKIVSSTACELTTTTDSIEETIAATANSFSYDATTDTYTFVWKTPKVKGCKELVLKFTDLREYRATFLLK